MHLTFVRRHGGVVESVKSTVDSEDRASVVVRKQSEMAVTHVENCDDSTPCSLRLAKSAQRVIFILKVSSHDQFYRCDILL